MSAEQDILTGSEPLERHLGYEPMVVADAAPSGDDLPAEAIMTEHELAHAKRPVEADWGHTVEREYFHNQTGEQTPENQTVSKEQAAHDLTQAREAELKAIENEAREALGRALDGTEQPQQDQQQPAIDEPQPESFTDEDAARAHESAAWAEADAAIEKMLQEPLVRERIQQSLDAVKAEASAKSERASRMSEAIQNHYRQATDTLVQEAAGIIGAVFPELNGLSGPQLQGALQILAQQNPQRAQAFQQLTARAQGLVEARQRQMHEHNMGLALKQEYEMKQFAEAETKKFEEATKYESAETLKQVRENVFPVAERYYGVPKQTLQAIYSGEQRVDGAALMRSAAFQLMMTDAIKYRLAQQNITQARSNPVKPVMRPGVSEPRGDDSDYASLERAFRGKDLSAKQAADLLIAHRGRR